MQPTSHWPQRLYLVRHGQSQGNVARDAADEAGAHEIDIDMRDVDVPLSDLGMEQARAAGHSTGEELLLLTTHGVLHLLGYDHAEPDEKEEMFSLQRELLAGFLGKDAPRETMK